MTAYAIFDVEVTDVERYEEYKKMVPSSIAAYGGKFVVRGGGPEVLEGQWAPRRIVMLEFPTVEIARQWLDSPEYAEARALRHLAATTNAIVVQGA
ncbi:DUF1330 domain-containing protein [Allopusillimonas ginsengisoli]|uniref:DUF1330 domain-containing protein n=1 Tax=Allopusillimonas ginsengisoli TaxID=453575 RepID=UPI0010C1BD83|nr:DUF1330 domain-containing protein [Allopusillimonas ginsengisoli]